MLACYAPIAESPPDPFPNTAIDCALLTLRPPGTNGDGPRLLDAAPSHAGPDVVPPSGEEDATVRVDLSAMNPELADTGRSAADKLLMFVNFYRPIGDHERVRRTV